jgi:hypothetical protein
LRTGARGGLRAIAVALLGIVFALAAAASARASVTPIIGSDIITTVAGNGTYGYSGDGGPALEAELGESSGIAHDAFGDLYVADSDFNVVRRVGPNGIITTVAGTGAYPPYGGPTGPVGDGGPGTRASLAYPSGLATDSAGNLDIADGGDGEVRQLTARGTINAIAGHWSSVRAVGLCSGVTAQMRFHYAAGLGSGPWSAASPWTCFSGVTMGPQALDGNLAVWPGETVRAGYDIGVPGNTSLIGIKVQFTQVQFTVGCVSGATPSVSTLTVSMPDASFTINDGAWYPTGDPNSPASYQGSVVVPDLCGGGRISLGQGATFTAVLGQPAGDSGDGGPATAAAVTPSQIAVDRAGDLFISDGANNVIRMVPARTGFYYGQFMWAGDIYTIAGNGTLGVTDSVVPARHADLALGDGQIAVDNSGDVYIVEGASVVVLVLTPDGWLHPFAGNNNLPNNSPSGDGGAATQAEVPCPEGVAVNALGDVLISDVCFDQVREVTPDGRITTVVNDNFVLNPNTYWGGYSGDGGPAIDAYTSLLNGYLAFDPAGNLYIDDAGNNVVREVSDGPSFHGYLRARTARAASRRSPSGAVVRRLTSRSVLRALARVSHAGASATPGSAALGLRLLAHGLVRVPRRR